MSDYVELVEKLKTAIDKKDSETIFKIFTVKNAAILMDGQIEVKKHKDRFEVLKEFFPGLKGWSDDQMLKFFDKPMTREEMEAKLKELKITI